MNRVGRPLLWATAVLLLMYGLGLSSLSQLGPTFDEQGFLVRGLAYIRQENRQLRVGHPLGLNALNALPLWRDTAVQLPTTDPSWQETSFHRPAELFLWEIGNDVEHVMFLARLPTLWLGLFLAALAGRWAWQMSGRQWAGVLALALIALDPNILAHTRLTTTDLGLALGAALAGYSLWWFLKRPSWANAAWAGIGFGLLQNTKFTAGLFVPLFTIVIFIGLLVQWRNNLSISQSPQHLPQFPWRTLLMLLTVYPLMAFLTLWAAYGFQIGTLPQSLPTFDQLSGLTIPLSHHVEQLLDIGGRLQVETPAFLLGQYSSSGWWYYFPVAFLLKTPLPILILLLFSLTMRGVFYLKNLRRQHSTLGKVLLDDAALLIPAFGYFAIALTSEINLGYRHLLPILPFFAVFTANSMSNLSWLKKQARLRTTAVAFSLILFTLSLWIYPHYLSYFNVLAGGPDNGWRHLVDSNIDWGQDLNKLKDWMAENDVDQVWLSYFGEARPEYYGIDYTGLDSWPPRLMNPAARPFYPQQPAPGTYAISATNLQGVHFNDHDQFAYFRRQTPVAKIGYSIFIFEVPAHGEAVNVLMAGVQLDEIDPEHFALFNSNDLVPRWFDPESALLLPPSGQGWLVLAAGTAVSPALAAVTESGSLIASQDGLTIYQLQEPPLPAGEPLTKFQSENGSVSLRAAAVETTAADQPLVITTTWQQHGRALPLKIFLHLINDAGDIVAQWDGLPAAWEGWRPGDYLLIHHEMPLPADLPPAEYSLRAGVYEPQNGTRWLTAVGSDFVEIGTVRIGE